MVVAQLVELPRFESSHRQILYVLYVTCIKKTKINKKRPRMAQFLREKWRGRESSWPHFERLKRRKKSKERPSSDWSSITSEFRCTFPEYKTGWQKKSPRIDIGNLLFQNNMMIIFVEQLIRGSNTYLVFANLLWKFYISRSIWWSRYALP